MTDLSTHYLGLELKNPIVPSSSPLSRDPEKIMQLQEAGAAAIVMHSLFEEKIEQEAEHFARFFHQQSLGHGEADSFHPVPEDYRSYQDDHLELLHKLKSDLDIPVIASLNGTTPGGWVEYGKALQQAGADALELNVFYVAANAGESGTQVESRYVDILRSLKAHVSIPITMKLSPQFSALVDAVQRFEQAGASGVVLFNRFYQPDINLETLEVVPKLSLSNSSESLLRIRWAAILYGQINCSLAVTGGFHSSEDILKALLAGADVVHMCSKLLEGGPQAVARALAKMELWLEQREYDSITQLKGSISRQHAVDPAAYARANYIDVLDSYTPPDGVLF